MIEYHLREFLLIFYSHQLKGFQDDFLSFPLFDPPKKFETDDKKPDP
jgi:hypothetical protein